MHRITIDTNVIISALISPGICRKILDLARRAVVEIVVSPFILEEAACVLQKKFHWNELAIEEALSLLEEKASIVHPSRKLSVVRDDETDNRIVECAVEGGVEFLVSGDGHLLSLKEYQGIQIVKPREFLRFLAS